MDAGAKCKFQNDLSDSFLKHMIFASIHESDVYKFRVFVRAGIPLSLISDENGRTLLHDACSVGELEIAKELLAAKADPFVKDKWHRTPIDVRPSN